MQDAKSGETAAQAGVFERAVVVVGVGLIGGSIAAAVRAANPSTQVIGVGRNPERLQHAVRKGLLTDWASQISQASIPPGSLGVVCLPVDQIADTAAELLQAGCSAVTDAGSTKQAICSRLATEPNFVGAHPIAGSELAGFEHADKTLFEGRVCVLCPEKSPPDIVQRVAAFWQNLGMSLQFLPAAEHDRVLALTSHLPHVLASVATGVVSDEKLVFAGSGFRDTTRIAAGSAEIWPTILMENAGPCIEAIRQAETLLEQFRLALTNRDITQLRLLWSTAAERRRKLT
ncbi:MAG: Arogenate dehydrogenase [Planctomycetota bacterium]|jgi:prephenate dehydrogenase